MIICEMIGFDFVYKFTKFIYAMSQYNIKPHNIQAHELIFP